ncbi:hypothetical protein [Ancylobacter polymorphus]|uniref:Uncharacterized protein n=1 Tax=Ancylobacter polymorphus TaxID=223390 RepID=A0ABU0BHJ9_9HYPH|nr:hypothetical protein [Ancylobacter polymorphus]MDQ0305296.1 hypothetical protein [Ancylobacter polymorphus]
MSKLRPANDKQSYHALACGFRLRAALEDAEAADCPKLAQSIRRSLKSYEGASRHLKRRSAATPAEATP